MPSSSSSLYSGATEFWPKRRKTLAYPDCAGLDRGLAEELVLRLLSSVLAEFGFRWESIFGVYTLVIETEGVDPNSFNCGQQNDVGLGQDAPSGNGINIGINPSMGGEGCFSGSDESDIFAFAINNNENFDFTFDADTSLPFTATLQDAAGNLVAYADNTSYGMVFQSLDTPYEGQTKDYTIIVDAGGASGLYNMSLNMVGSAPADVGIDLLVCPGNHTSGEEVQVSWELISLRGPANDATIVIHVDLLDANGSEIADGSGVADGSEIADG